MKVDQSLNKDQQEAMRHVEGPALVLAGAGSGKTRIVCARIGFLISLGVPSHEILALTFTNKAAQEMRSRVYQAVDQNVLACTFHSLCARMLRESIGALGFQTNFAIYDEKDAEQVFKSCIEDLGYKLDKGMIKSLRASISNAKNDLLTPQDVHSLYQGPNENLISEVYTCYQQRLKEYNALDFDDLLFLTVQLFEKHPEVLKTYQERWQFILIDEYQDTNSAQYHLIQQLGKNHRNIFAVGDPDQSIYSWRGANIQNILQFESDFPGAKVIKLEQNYRSTENILNAANRLISHNQMRYEKKLWSDLGEGEKVVIRFSRSEREEAEFVTEELIRYCSQNHISYSDSAILYRTNSQSRAIEDHLLRENLPYLIIGGISFYQRREIKDLLAYLRLLISDHDFLSFVRILNAPKRGIGPTTIDRLKTACEQHQKPILQTIERILSGEIQDVKLSKKQKTALEDFWRELQYLRSILSKASIETILIETVERFGYLNFLKEDPESFQDRKENLDELINKASEWGDETNLQLFLEELTLKSSTDDLSANQHGVRLMTLHNAKGLEFSTVFIVGLEEDILPHINSKNSPEEVEEERRLLYVGMTRARQKLYITGSTYRTIWGTPKVMEPSRFLREIPSNLLSKQERLHEIEEMEGDALPEGTLVQHFSFGQGEITRSYHTSMGLTYDIYFHEDHSNRSLVAKYAKLKVIN